MDKRRMLQGLLATGLVAGMGLGLAGCSRQQEVKLQGVDVTGAEYAKDFPLPDADGKLRSIKDFAGKVTVVFFGYTQCPDVCPTTLQELVEVKQMLGAQGDKLQGVFVSLDPERDTPEVLKAYVGNFDPSMVALTGTPEQVAAVAKDFKVFFRKVEGKVPGAYTLDHTAGLYMYDPQGRLRAYHRYGAGAQPLVADAQVLLAEK
ncbi:MULTISPECIES: SCO family protein [Comamonas]|uniref:SCO family protein n=2 Tax=Comamonas terrigena TaxID=32013 RepID=A0A2A7UTC8_COMTR|nr:MULTISPECIES: SCO family protein [Comamonas]MBD9532331.1 SCO family protein [Comamonas sp. CMM01]PEH88523.1 SCO family protein [Comamonas terrigena]SUY88041.1 BsSco [Comamonas terrigena]